MGLITMAMIGRNTRVYLADTTDMVEEARVIHDTSPVATAALGRTLTAASIMGKMLKGDKDKLTLQIKGKGLIRSMVAVAWPSGDVKITISDPKVDLDVTPQGKLDVGGAVGLDGEVIVIRDYGLKDPYIGRSPLVSGEIAEDLAYYYAHSEQQPSIIALGVLADPRKKVAAAGGFFAQTMPDISEEEIAALEADIAVMPGISGIIGLEATPEEKLQKLFPGLPVTIKATYEVKLTCDCSKEKLSKALITVGEKALREMLEEDKQAELHCHFCQKAYHFDEADLKDLIKASQKK